MKKLLLLIFLVIFSGCAKEPDDNVEKLDSGSAILLDDKDSCNNDETMDVSDVDSVIADVEDFTENDDDDTLLDKNLNDENMDDVSDININDEDSEIDKIETDINDEEPDIDYSGIYPECEPGSKKKCFEGPSNTKNVGQCKEGISTCTDDGAFWGECIGQVLPSPEICGDGKDQDCDGKDMTIENMVDIDGDGYTYCEGDCCETYWDNCHIDPELVNPGADESFGNGVDDNCNGYVDEVTVFQSIPELNL